LATLCSSFNSWRRVSLEKYDKNCNKRSVPVTVLVAGIVRNSCRVAPRAMWGLRISSTDEGQDAEMQFVEDLRLFLKTYPKTTVRTL
jgi:hypothetical protein